LGRGCRDADALRDVVLDYALETLADDDAANIRLSFRIANSWVAPPGWWVRKLVIGEVNVRASAGVAGPSPAAIAASIAVWKRR
jgi:hypothetical protein